MLILTLDEQKARRPTGSQPTTRRPNYGEYGGVPFAQGLGAAGAQFLEQTPWANPQHPSNAHLLHRQPPPQQHEIPKSVPNVSTTPKRQSNQTNPFSPSTISNSSNHGQIFPPSNGNGSAKNHKNLTRQVSTSPEVTRAASLLEQTSARSHKVAAAAAAAAAVAAAPGESPVKRENMHPVGGGGGGGSGGP